MESDSLKVEEFYERNIGEALGRLGEIFPGQSIIFVGIRSLADTLVSEAESQGLKLSVELKEGFDTHVLTLLEKQTPEKLVQPEQEIGKFRSWFRNSVSLLLSVFPRSQTL